MDDDTGSVVMGGSRATADGRRSCIAGSTLHLVPDEYRKFSSK